MTTVDQGQSFLEAQAHNVQHVHEQGHTHVVAPKTLLAVYAGLLVLTVATVAVTAVNLGSFNIWMALFIAVAKAGLVAMYFMHLRWDSPFNGIILIVALFFVALFIGFAVMDSSEYKDNYTKPQPGQSMSVPGQQ